MQPRVEICGHGEGEGRKRAKLTMPSQDIDMSIYFFYYIIFTVSSMGYVITILKQLFKV
jgi:hypothetical protein